MAGVMPGFEPQVADANRRRNDEYHRAAGEECPFEADPAAGSGRDEFSGLAKNPVNPAENGPIWNPRSGQK